MKYIYTLILTLSFTFLFAQSDTNPINETENQAEVQDQEFEYFAKNKVRSHGLYLGVGVGYFQKSNNDFLSLSSRISYIANNRFEIGLGGEVFSSYSELSNDIEDIDFLVGSVGGLHMKAIFYGNKKVHFSVPVFFGGGAIAEANSNGGIFSDCFSPESDEWEPLLLMDVGVNAELNISRILGLEVGAKYRFSNDFNLANNPMNDLNAFNLSATLKIGIFDLNFRRARKKSF